MKQDPPIDGHFACEVLDQVIVVRLQGEPTARMLEECQAEVISLVQTSGLQAVLYDLRPLVDPGTALLHQQALEQEIRGMGLRRAVIVSGSSIGYLARLAFSADACSVFYNDYDAAVRFLAEGHLPSSAWSLAVSEDRRIRERRSQVERQLPGRRRATP